MRLTCCLTGQTPRLPVITDEVRVYDFFALATQLMSQEQSTHVLTSIHEITLINSEIPEDFVLDHEYKQKSFALYLAFKDMFPSIRVHGIFSLLKPGDLSPLHSSCSKESIGVFVSEADYEYVVAGNLDEIQRIVARIGLNNYLNHDKTILYLAIEYGHTSVVQWLLKQPGINMNEGHIHSRATPLHMAVSKGNLPLVDELLKHPDINVNASKKDGEDTTPLHMAVILGLVDIVDSLLLCKKTNPHSLNSHEKIALQCALDANHKTVTALLLNHALYLMIDSPQYMLSEFDQCMQLYFTLKNQRIALWELLKSEEVALSLDDRYLPLLKLISNPLSAPHPLRAIFYCKKRPTIFSQKALLDEVIELIARIEDSVQSELDTETTYHASTY